MPPNGYRLVYKKSVDKDLRKLSESIRKQLVKKIRELSKTPRPSGSTKLRGSTDLYRIRHTDYRIIYQIKGSELIILIIKVGHRKEVYRDL
jgi:mRNA interferase RelE/StbE